MENMYARYVEKYFIRETYTGHTAQNTETSGSICVAGVACRRKGTGMTERDAVELVENFTHWNLAEQWLDEDDMCEFAEIVKTALEKQIPKKLEIRNATCADIESELRDFITSQGKICRCPTCKNTICVSGIEYCWYCGQKLDWSDEE